MAATGRLLDSDQLQDLQNCIDGNCGQNSSGGGNDSATGSGYDYVRLSWCDLHGNARGFTIPAVHARSFLRSGYSAFSGSIAFGHTSVDEDLFENIIKTHGVENCNFVPAIPRLYSLPWVDSVAMYKTAEVICEAFWEDGQPFSALPRYAARMQVKKLEQMGYRMLCAFESEFTVLNPETQQPDFPFSDYISHMRVSSNAKWLYEMDKQLRANGIDIRCMHAEYWPSQFEITFTPEDAMTTLDNMYIYKQAIAEIARNHGKLVTFMSQIDKGGACNGLHFNHSLWDSEKRNAFWDASKANKLSDIGRYWIGGTLKHLHALTALCCPTVNCYRRLHTPIVPSKPNWSIDDRHMALRVVNKEESAMRLENRLPSSACNTYLAVAASIAAGIDGIRNKIEPPAEGMNPEASDLPHSLDEAIEVLQKDDVILEALGEELVSMFFSLKRNLEIKRFKHHDMQKFIGEEISAERAFYMEHFQPKL